MTPHTLHHAKWAKLVAEVAFLGLARRNPVVVPNYQLTLSLPRVINLKFPLQPHQKYTSHSTKNVAFHSLLRLIMVMLQVPTNSRWENVLFELESERVKLPVKRMPFPVTFSTMALPSVRFPPLSRVRLSATAYSSIASWRKPENSRIWRNNMLIRQECIQLDHKNLDQLISCILNTFKQHEIISKAFRCGFYFLESGRKCRVFPTW